MSPGTTLFHPERGDLVLTDVLFALSDPTRLELTAQLQDGPQPAASCVTADADTPKSTKSHQLKVLRECGIIRNEPDGRNRILTLRREDLDARFPGLLDSVLPAATRA